jgi:hypothetical protein
VDAEHWEYDLDDIAVAIIFVVVNYIRLRSIFPKHLEFQRATAGYSMLYFRRFATRLFANAIVLRRGLDRGATRGKD